MEKIHVGTRTAMDITYMMYIFIFLERRNLWYSRRIKYKNVVVEWTELDSEESTEMGRGQ